MQWLIRSRKDLTGIIRMYQQRDREMHEVTCADCGKKTEVPFKPDGSRPVYCKECFQKHKPKRF